MTENVHNLSQKQLRFCLEYIKHSNAKKAAIAAGYSEHSAAAQGSRLLTNAKVKAWLQKQTTQIAEQAGITADKVLQEMAAVGMTRITDVMEWDANGNMVMKESAVLTPEQAAAISEVTQVEVVNPKTGDITTTTRLKLHPKVTALTKLAEWLGIGPDQLPPSVQVNIQAQDGSKVAVQINDVVKDYGEALDQAIGIVKEIPPKQIGGKDHERITEDKPADDTDI
jgi:phage terminase small subunit